MTDNCKKLTELISYEEARDCLKTNFSPLNSIEKFIAESIHHYVAVHVKAINNWPSYSYATQNGYAIQAASTEGASDYFPLVLKDLSPCIKMAAGSAMPDDTDAVINIRDVTHANEIIAPIPVGKGVCLEGGDLHLEQILLEKGTNIQPHHVHILQRLGIQKMEVFPRISFQILEKNSSKIHAGFASALLKDLLEGIKIYTEVKTFDHYHELEALTKKSLEKKVVQVIIGGSGDGEDDQTADLLQRWGIKKIFHGVGLNECVNLGVFENKGIPLFLVPSAPRATLASYIGFFVPFLETCYAHFSLYRSFHGRNIKKIISPVGMASFVAVKCKDEHEIMPLYGQEQTSLHADGGFIIPSSSEGYAEGSEITYKSFSAR